MNLKDIKRIKINRFPVNFRFIEESGETDKKGKKVKRLSEIKYVDVYVKGSLDEEATRTAIDKYNRLYKLPERVFEKLPKLRDIYKQYLTTFHDYYLTYFIRKFPEKFIIRGITDVRLHYHTYDFLDERERDDVAGKEKEYLKKIKRSVSSSTLKDFIKDMKTVFPDWDYYKSVSQLITNLNINVRYLRKQIVKKL